MSELSGLASELSTLEWSIWTCTVYHSFLPSMHELPMFGWKVYIG